MYNKISTLILVSTLVISCTNNSLENNTTEEVEEVVIQNNQESEEVVITPEPIYEEVEENNSIEEKEKEVEEKEIEEYILNYSLETRYINYDGEVAGTSPLSIIFFDGERCGTCTSFKKSVEQNINAIPEDIIIHRVNYNLQRDLVRKFKADSVGAFVLIDGDKDIRKTWYGSESLDEMLGDSGLYSDNN